MKYNTLMYFTTYNLYATIAAKLLGARLPCALVDLVRGTALIVAAAVAYIYVTLGSGALLSMYARMLPGWPTWLYLLYDWLIHFGPTIVMGLPRSGWSLLTAYALMVAWYCVVRGDVRSMYIPSAPLAMYDTLVFFLGGAALTYALFTHLTHSHAKVQEILTYRDTYQF